MVAVTRLRPRTGYNRPLTEKFGPIGEFYDLLHVENGVTTPGGPGTLVQVFDSQCLVLLMRQKATGRNVNGTPYRPLTACPTSEVRPA